MAAPVPSLVIRNWPGRRARRGPWSLATFELVDRNRRRRPPGPCWRRTARCPPDRRRHVRGGQRQRRDAEQHSFRWHQPVLIPAAADAVTDMSDEAFAPDGGRFAVPAVQNMFHPGAVRQGLEGPPHGADCLELTLHPMYPNAGLVGVDGQRRCRAVAGELAERFPPPQRQHLLVPVVQPAGRLGQLPALRGQHDLGNRLLGEIGVPVRLRVRQCSVPHPTRSCLPPSSCCPPRPGVQDVRWLGCRWLHPDFKKQENVRHSRVPAAGWRWARSAT
jgi:hypothetical protein